METLQKLTRNQAAISRSTLTDVLSRIERFAKLNSLSVQITSTSTANQLRSFTTEKQNVLAQSLESWIQSYELVSAGHIRASTDIEALKRYAQIMGYKIDDGFCSTLREGDCVEAYEFLSDYSGAIQSWRNWKFLELSSYDLMSLMLQPMHELFYRDAEVQMIIDKLVIGLIPDPRTKLSGIPPHVLTEIKEKHNRQFKIENRFVSPIIDIDDRVVGFLSSLSAKPLGSVYADLNVHPLSN